MKRKKILQSMQMIDDHYVEEAALEHKPTSKKRILLSLVAAAACFAILFTGCGLWLFLPYNTSPPDVSGYADSPYYDIIQKLNVLTYRLPTHKNNFEKISNKIGGIMSNGEILDAAADGSNGAPKSDRYVETTDNQVSSVIEADLIKRSDTHIYYMNDGFLEVYDIKGADSQKIGSYKIPKPSNLKFYGDYYFEFFLTPDCRSVIYLISYTDQQNRSLLDVVSLDVTDPVAITEQKKVTLDGYYVSSRLVDGKLLLVTNFCVESPPDFSKENEFIPQIDLGNGFESISVGCIITPDSLTSPEYAVITMLDANSLSFDGTTALLSCSSEIYVSEDSVYVTNAYTDSKKDGNATVTNAMTEIFRVEYAGGTLALKGSVTVLGHVKDQYSLDEHEGILRVVTTTNYNRYPQSSLIDDGLIDRILLTNASLYCIDVSDMSTRALVESFAPTGERVQSVRFDGALAYVCTSIGLSDPVFFFDLSDLDHITVKDTGTIEGYSTSLVQFGDGLLLGIGYGNSRNTVKIEVYEETEDAVRSLASFTLNRSDFSESYKSYLIDRENGLIGLGFTCADYDEAERYVLLHFDGTQLCVMLDIPLAGENRCKRAVYIDGDLYLFGQNHFRVERIEQ